MTIVLQMKYLQIKQQSRLLKLSIFNGQQMRKKTNLKKKWFIIIISDYEYHIIGYLLHKSYFS